MTRTGNAQVGEVRDGAADPDAGGPKTAVTHDHNGDGRIEHCHQSGYQNRPGAAGNLEYHARLNNTTTPGQQRVLFCHDPDQDGCLDESVRSQIAIGWVSPPSSPTGRSAGSRATFLRSLER